MPAASLARLEKQASLDANDPLKQGIVIIEHKIRNLEKRKSKLDAYRDLQKSGKDLQYEQLEAVSKYDAVIAHLEFAKELSKQLATLATESAKNLKKQARKEAAERAQQELARTKEILIINDLLSSMGQPAVREELLSGKSKVTLTETELQAIDELYEELTPKKEEPMAFTEMFQTPAEAMHHLLEGKNKAAFGTTYSALKTKLFEIATSGYFDTLPPAPEVESEPSQPEPEQAPAPVELPHETADPNVNQVETPVVQQQQQPSQAPLPQPPIVAHSFQPAKAQPTVGQVHPADVDSSIVRAIPAQPHLNQPPQQQIEMAYYTPSHLRVFKSGTIDFMQDNELDTPENTENSASAIPTMTFANQSFTSDEPQMPSIPPVQHHIDMQHQHPSQYQPPAETEDSWGSGGGDTLEAAQQPAPAQQPVNAWTSIPSEQQQPSPQNMNQNMNDNNDDWADQCDQWSMNQVNSAASNDGFITAGSGRGRGGRGRRGVNDRGGGGDRGSRGGYGGNGPRGNQSGRNSYRGEGGYNRDREGGYMRGEGGGNYYKDQNNSGGYQNGYQNNRSSRGGSGPPRQPQDRQGGTGGGRGGGNRGRGGYRGGGNNSGGNNYRQ